jgi:hypothetical protein
LVNQLPPRGEPISQIECHSTDSVFKFKARFLLLHVPDGGRVDGKGLSNNPKTTVLQPKSRFLQPKTNA